MGLDSMRLGAGREKKDDIIDPAAGIILNKKLGDKVNKGDVLMTLYTEKANMQDMVTSILANYEINDDPIDVPPVVEEIISYNPKTEDFDVQSDRD